MRLGFARINQETHCLSPIATTLADFERTHLLRGEALAEACGRRRHEVPGLLKHAELSGFVREVQRAGAEAVPLLSAWAMPSGPLTAETVHALRDELVDAIAAAEPLDGLYLCLHGAMGAQGLEAPEALFVAAAREALGDRPLTLSFDLHGILTPAVVEPADLLVAYRTNPHRDHAQTGARAGRLLCRAVAGQIQPRIVWRSLPMILGGGSTVDFLKPMRRIFRRARALEKQPGVLATSLFMCHFWSDSPDLGWSVAVVGDGESDAAELAAEELADAVWAVRDQKAPAFLPAEEAVARARKAWLRRKLGTVTLSDVSDVTAAGAPGDNTRLLRVLLDRAQGLTSFAALRAPEAFETLEAPGQTVDLVVGEPALSLSGRLVRLDENTPFGKRAVLDCGHLKLVVTETAPLSLTPHFYSDAGLDPWRADVVVAKSFFHFRWHFLAQNRLTLYAQTQGLTDLDALNGRVQFRDAVWPWQPVADWRPADRRRRGV